MENKYFSYLEKLRMSGETNMFGAVKYLETAFPELTTKKAREVLKNWINSKMNNHADTRQ